jgi:hypothetical protein
LAHLDASGNDLGQLVSSDGWEANSNGTHYRQHGGNWTTIVPAGLQPLGIIAIANAIPDMGALTSLNLSSNDLKPEGAKIVADAIEVTCAIAVVLVPFSCPSDHLVNCCCLLLSTG